MPSFIRFDLGLVCFFSCIIPCVRAEFLEFLTRLKNYGRGESIICTYFNRNGVGEWI